MELLKDKIYFIVKQKILDCDLKPGEFIQENQFIKQLDVSRTPLREAFSKLEEEGLLHVISKKGVQVKNLSLVSITHTYEARLLLEPFILRNYWDNLNLNDLKDIKNKIIELKSNKPQIITEEYIDSFFQLDNLFHRTICKACSNGYLVKSLMNVDDEVERVRKALGKNSRYSASAEEHLKIINDILNNDRDAAIKELSSHINKSKNIALQSMSFKDIDYKVFD